MNAGSRLPAAALRRADEVFASSSGGGVLPVARVDGRPLPAWPGPGTTRLRDACRALREEPAHGGTVVDA